MWLGRTSILLVFTCSIILLLTHRRDRTTSAILAVVAALICVGFIGKGSGNSQEYVQLAQLAIVAAIWAATKRVVATSAFNVALLAAILVSIAINLAFHETATYTFTVNVGVFGNPNGLAIHWLILFLLSSFIAWHSKGLIRLSAILICAFLVYLTIDTGSRGALLAMTIYVAMMAGGIAIHGKKTALQVVAAAVIISVPSIVIAYPIWMGYHINFRLPASARAQLNSADKNAERLVGAPSLFDVAVCVPSTLQSCDTDTRATHAPTYVSAFGLSKNLGSGRQVIWPSIIEISGETVAFGHGLGTLPGAYLAGHYTGLSAHNGFLQVYFQFGLIGLALYLTLWILLFVRAIRLPDVITRCSATAIIVVACIIETFQVAMIQNNFGAGVALALLITTQIIAHRETTPP